MRTAALSAQMEQKVQESFRRQPFMALLGAELGRVETGKVEIRLAFHENLTQQHGFLHAGVLTSIADSACGYAALTMMEEGSDVLSVEFKINLLRPARGSAFRAVAQVLKSGKTLSVVQAEVLDSEDQLVALMTATMMQMRERSVR